MLLVIVGPTASGKTELSLDLADALGGEIVNADSVQVYRGFDIGSGKPTLEMRARAVHHLIDVCDPLEPLNAADWAKRAESAVEAIEARGKVPIVCGGTFLWIRALLFGLVPTPPADPEIREAHRRRAEQLGREALHAELREVDAISAEKLAPTDLMRVSRALEVHQLTGVPLSRWHAEHGFRTARHAAKLLGIQHERESYDRRVKARVASMLDAGFIDEVRELIGLGYEGARAMGSVGYRQVRDALVREELDRSQLLDDITRATRVFARRQRTWLRDQAVTWLAPDIPPSERIRLAQA